MQSDGKVEAAEETKEHLRTSKSWSREYNHGSQRGNEASGRQIRDKKEMIASREFNDAIPLVPGELNASQKVETERIKRKDKGRSVYLGSEDHYGKEVGPLS